MKSSWIKILATVAVMAVIGIGSPVLSSVSKSASQNKQVKTKTVSSTTTATKTPAKPNKPAPKKPAKPKALPRLLDLGSDKCVPCKMMIPVLDELRKDYKGKLKVDFIDVWKDEAAAKKYKVKSIPTQIFFDAKGKEVYRHVGFISKEDILKAFKKHGIKL
jgi:thioredoxin 1